MNTEDYNKKIEELLDPMTYKKQKNDTTPASLRISLLLRKLSLPEIVKRKKSIPHRLYGLLKVHKNKIPLRPIVSSIRSPTKDLAKYLTDLLKPHIGNSHSQTILECIKCMSR